ncbi:MAG: dolichyl-phosphate beta-glucosyltransferase [Steroidobacteraceae bacterium]
MSATRPEARTTSSLVVASALRLVAGLALAAAAFASFPATSPLTAAAAGTALLGLLVAMLVRGLELRAWFGRGLSLHQSQSLQLVLDLARWASPLQDRRRLEVEFVARETGRASTAVAAWSRSRQWWRLVLLPALPALVATVILPDRTTAALAWLVTLVAMVSTSPHWRQPRGTVRGTLLRAHAAMVGCALAALAVEAVAFTAASHLLEPRGAAAPAGAAAIFVTLSLVRAVPAAPFGVGLYELLACAGLWAVGAAELAALAWFVHAAWIVSALAPGLAYLSRYKLTLGDLFDRRLPALLARSRRPADGWAADQETVAAEIEVSVAIPAYNERERLPRYLPEVLAHLRAQPYSWEVIVADDGSSDGTGEFVAGVAATEPRLRLVSRARNGGKGRAVLDAIEVARGRHVLVADADGATPIRELEALRAAVGDGAEIAIGSRVAPRAGRVRERAALRAVIGKVFYGLVNFLAVPGIGDTQCGFKLLRRDVARAVFRELGEFGWAFDVEILYRAQLAGYRVAEVAVEWHEIAGSKLRPVRDASRMLVSLFRIRARNAGFTGETGQALLGGRVAATLRDAA